MNFEADTAGRLLALEVMLARILAHVARMTERPDAFLESELASVRTAIGGLSEINDRALGDVPRAAMRAVNETFGSAQGLATGAGRGSVFTFPDPSRTGSPS